MKYIYQKRGLESYEDLLIISSSISFLNDVGRDYINCLSRILYHKQMIHRKRNKLTIEQSFRLENMRFILMNTFDKKKQKYSILSFAVDSKHGVRFH